MFIEENLENTKEYETGKMHISLPLVRIIIKTVFYSLLDFINAWVGLYVCITTKFKLYTSFKPTHLLHINM